MNPTEKIQEFVDEWRSKQQITGTTGNEVFMNKLAGLVFMSDYSEAAMQAIEKLSEAMNKTLQMIHDFDQNMLCISEQVILREYAKTLDEVVQILSKDTK